MKKLGIIGGIGPASTVDYYLGVIEGVRTTLNTPDYPAFLIDNINMTEMLGYIEKHDYPALILMLMNSILGLKAAGAELIAIASNTPHVIYEELATRTPVPVLSIVDATVDYSKAKGFNKVLLLGTKFTMTNDFYPAEFAANGIECITPSPDDIRAVHNIIFPKLEDGIVVEEDKRKLLALIERYRKSENIDAVVLGCTELPIMIKQSDLALPVINTTEIHIQAIVKEITANN